MEGDQPCKRWTSDFDREESANLKDYHFEYPGNFNPDKLADGSFGIYQTAGTRTFKILISFKEVLRGYITTRRWHPTQNFSELKEGDFTLEVHLKNTNELIPWVLEFGSDVR